MKCLGFRAATSPLQQFKIKSKKTNIAKIKVILFLVCVGSLLRECSAFIVHRYVYSSVRSGQPSLCAWPASVEALTSINRAFLHHF